MAQSNVHDGKCGPCHLCEKDSTKYTHLAITPNEACICYACYKQASRNINNSNFHPRWEVKPPSTEVPCSVLTCTNAVYRHSNIACRKEIEEIVEEKVVIPAADDDRATSLCQDHYCLVRTAINAPQSCRSCNYRTYGIWLRQKRRRVGSFVGHSWEYHSSSAKSRCCPERLPV